MEMKVNTLRIEELHFDAAHYLPEEFGECHNLHGHRWYIRDLVLTTNRTVDFRKVEEVIQAFDHCLLIPESDFEFWKSLNETRKLPFNLELRIIPAKETTVENLARHLQNLLEQIPGVLSAKFKLYEGNNHGVEV